MTAGNALGRLSLFLIGKAGDSGDEALSTISVSGQLGIFPCLCGGRRPTQKP